MKREKLFTIVCVFLACAFSGLAASQPALAWASEYSDGTGQFGPAQMKVDAKGNVYVVGTLKAKPSGLDEIFALKYNSEGLLQWSRTFSKGNNGDFGVCLAIDAQENVFIGGTTTTNSSPGEVMVLKCDRFGTLVWSATYGGVDHLSDTMSDIALEANGNVCVAGIAARNATFNDFLTLKLSPAGAVLWSATYSSTADNTSDDEPEHIRVDPGGNVYVGGTSSIAGHYRAAVTSYDSTGNSKWSNVATLEIIGSRTAGLELAPTGVYLVYPTIQFSATHLSLYSQTGSLSWDSVQRGYIGWDATKDAAGNIAVAGYHVSGMAAMKFSPTGHVMWTVDDSAIGNSWGIAAEGQNTYVAGLTKIGQNNVSTATKIDASGKVLWDIMYPLTPLESYFPVGICALPNGLVALESETSTSAKAVTAGFYQTPTATDDQYAITRDSQLNTTALNGVVANDSYASDGTVILTKDVNNGALTLNVDGSFSYIPNHNFVGNDTFNYRVYYGPTQSNVATVTISVQPALIGLSLSPSTVTGGNPTTGTVTLDASAPSGGVAVSLSATSAVILPPPSVTVPAGANTISFVANTLPVGTTYVRSISSTLNGVTKSANLTILPPLALTGLSLSPNSLVGGLNSQGTVTINIAAPAGGVVIALSDNSSAVTTPASVTVPQGSATANFTIGTAAVAAPSTRTVTATYNGVSKPANITLLPGTALVSLSFNPTTVQGGHTSQGTVSLVNPAPAGGALVILKSNSSVISVPASVLVLQGNKTCNFTASTAKVGATYVRTVDASYQGVTKTASLTITP